MFFAIALVCSFSGFSAGTNSVATLGFGDVKLGDTLAKVRLTHSLTNVEDNQFWAISFAFEANLVDAADRSDLEKGLVWSLTAYGCDPTVAEDAIGDFYRKSGVSRDQFSLMLCNVMTNFSGKSASELARCNAASALARYGTTNAVKALSVAALSEDGGLASGALVSLATIDKTGLLGIEAARKCAKVKRTNCQVYWTPFYKALNANASPDAKEQVDAFFLEQLGSSTNYLVAIDSILCSRRPAYSNSVERLAAARTAIRCGNEFAKRYFTPVSRELSQSGNLDARTSP